MPNRDMSGIMFRQHEKSSERAPDFTGRATMDGKEFDLAAWIREGPKSKFLSLKFTPKGQRPQRQQRSPDDDSTPF